jgi:hypothetical protein
VELNARASSPGGVKVAPVKSLAHVAPIVPTAARAVGVGVGSRFDPNDLVRKAEAHREAVQSALAAADASPAPEAGVTCANCRTQKTPLWRNGPLGPKTLCNACGVRFKLGKLPPPGGWPPGHVPPPAPPRKRPAHGDAQGGKALKASSGLSKRVDETKSAVAATRTVISVTSRKSSGGNRVWRRVTSTCDIVSAPARAS